MPLRFPTDAPLAETWELVRAGKADPTGVETIDLAFWVGGTWHAALRGGSSITDLIGFGDPDGGVLPTGEVIADLTDDEVIAACEKYLPEDGFAASTDGRPSAAVPWGVVAPLVFELVLRFLRRRRGA